MVDNNSIVEGSVKFRDGKKWKSRWCVMRKLSPVADCLHLQLYRDSRDRYKQGQTKASLSLQHFLGVETGFTLDKESNTIAIVCQDVTVVLAFDTRERLIQWQVKISNNLGEGLQFLVLVSQAPSKAKISTGPARLHVQEMKFCMTSGVPPRLVGFWEIGHLRRYGVVEGRFCFEGGSRCGKGEGLFVLVTDLGAEITKAFQMAAQGKLSSRRKPVSRNSSTSESPRKISIPKSEIRGPNYPHEALVERGSERRSSSPYWSVESRRTDLDSNYGCGDTVSVHVLPDISWPSPDGKGMPSSLERCVSCISKLGAPSLSRSSTANTSTLFSPAWTMEPIPACHHQSETWGSSSDRISMSSRGSSGSCTSEYSAAKNISPEIKSLQNFCPPLPPKSSCTTMSPVRGPAKCHCCPPSRPPKPTKEHLVLSPTRRKNKKPPLSPPSSSSKSCDDYNNVGPYENYDVPKKIIKNVCEKQSFGELGTEVSLSPAPSEFYDTPKSLKENVGNSCFEVANYGNYDTPPPAKTIRKPCGCIVTFARQAVNSEPRGECPCQKVLCWAENWMILPYCKRGRGVENTAVPIHKVKLSGEGKMPVVNPSGEIAVYASAEKSKTDENLKKENEKMALKNLNYENLSLPEAKEVPAKEKTFTNYENIEFAHSLAHYENSKDVLEKAGIKKEDLCHILSNQEPGPDISFSDHNGMKVCNKCGHTCEIGQDKGPATQQSKGLRQEDYLVMGPSQGIDESSTPKANPNFLGYLPMFPGNKAEAIKLLPSGIFPVEKSASISSLPSATKEGKIRTDSGGRFPGSAMPVMPSAVNPHVRKLFDLDKNSRKPSSRKRSSSADSSRYIEDYEESESRGSSLSSPNKIQIYEEKPASNSLTSLPCENSKNLNKVENENEKTQKNFFRSNTIEKFSHEVVCERTKSPNTKVQVHETSGESGVASIFIRRSSSVPCKSGNRDSSSSNDSGVSTGSLKQRGKDYAEFELPLATAASSKRHQSAIHKYPGTVCLHASLPRKSKSSDPLRELTFQFHGIKIPAKSSSAEAEVPLCRIKKGYFSPGDGVSVPYMDSRSTSSGTSDMSDYIETLSLSSHSSSDAPESTLQRISRTTTTTTLKPRTGNEYHKIDRSILSGDSVKNQKGRYANIGPLPEKSESPSPGYVSSSPAHEVQCTDF